MSHPIDPSHPISRRSFVIGGLAVAVAIATGGCSELAARLAPAPDASVYRSQIRLVEPLAGADVEETAAALEARLRFLADPTSRVLTVRPESGPSFFLAEVPSDDPVVLDRLVLAKGRLSLVTVDAGAKLGVAAPKGSPVVVADLRVADVRLAAGPTGEELLELSLPRDAAAAVGSWAPDGQRRLGIVADGTLLLAASIEAPIRDGRMAIASPAHPATLRTLGALLRSGPIPTDLLADPNGDIQFED